MKQRRISNSPLIDPALSALIIITAAHDALDDPQQVAVTHAARILDVPVFALLRVSNPTKVVAARGRRRKYSPRSFMFEEHTCPWSDPTFVDALSHEDRSILLLAGTWLEHQVLGTALHGLAEGYDACFLVDATTAQAAHAAQPAHDRLVQAGAVPVVTSQVLHEWMIETPDPVLRSAVQPLFAAAAG